MERAAWGVKPKINALLSYLFEMRNIASALRVRAELRRWDGDILGALPDDAPDGPRGIAAAPSPLSTRSFFHFEMRPPCDARAFIEF